MKKPILIMTIFSVIALGIAGCGQHHQTKSNPNKSASSADMANSSSNANKKNNLTSYQYHVPTKATHSKNYVKKGQLKNRSQFRYDQYGTKQQLAKVGRSSQKLTVGKMTYQVTRVRIIKNEAKTAQAKQAAMQVLNVTKLPTTYYTFNVHYEVTNNHSFQVVMNGILSAKTNAGQTLTSADQLTDSSAGNRVKARKTRTFVATGYLYNYGTSPASTLAITFGETFTTHGQKVDSKSPTALKIFLK